MRKRWLVVGIGTVLPLTLVLSGRLWAPRPASRPGVGSPVLIDPSRMVLRPDQAGRWHSASPREDGWRELLPEPLAAGRGLEDLLRIQKAQTSGGTVGPTKPTLLAPPHNSSVAPGGSIRFTWSAVAGAGFYFFEYTGPNLRFTNPNGTWPDVRNGVFGAGGGFVVPETQTSLDVTVEATTPGGAYGWRVIAILPNSNQIGVFSDARTISIGALGTTPTGMRQDEMAG